MIPCSAAEICRAVGGTLLQDADAAVTNVSTDSRTAAAGDLFIPLVGEKFDGHAYLDGALARGAAGCLTMHAPTALQPGKFYILVDDTLLALRALASWYRGRFTLPVVQITGSAGKTTFVQSLMATVLPSALPPIVMPEISAVMPMDSSTECVLRSRCSCVTMTAAVEPLTMPQMSPTTSLQKELT